MDAALLVVRVLPPPAAGARVLAGLDRAGAGRAADRREALVVQRVHRHAVLLGVGAHLLHGPGDEGVYLRDPVVRGVDLDLGALGARHRLPAAQAREPGVEVGERAAERLHLSDAAALVAVVERIAEAVEAL